MFMIGLIILSICLVLAAGNGVVKIGMPSGDTWNNEIDIYSYKLMCDYQHYFMKKHKSANAPWSYVIECRETSLGGDKKARRLQVKYDLTWIDNFEVTSCALADVTKSIFPPEQKRIYTPEDGIDNLGRPRISYLKYIDTEGRCFIKKYKFSLNTAQGADRNTPDQVGCDEDTSADIPKFATFGNCIEPKPVEYIVTSWNNDPNLVWTEEDKKKTKLLECSYNHVYQEFRLTCVQDNAPDKYQAVVMYKKTLLDVFTVTSCDQEKIVNGIYPRKHLIPDSVQIELWFGKPQTSESPENRCYQRVYIKNGKRSPEDPNSVFCPNSNRIDEWVNPTWGKTGQWYLCSKPTIDKSTSGAQEGQTGASNGQGGKGESQAGQEQAGQPQSGQAQAGQPQSGQAQAGQPQSANQ